MRQGKLNHLQKISASSVSMDFILTVIVLTIDGPKDVDYIILFNSLMYFPRVIWEALSGIFWLVTEECLK